MTELPQQTERAKRINTERFLPQQTERAKRVNQTYKIFDDSKSYTEARRRT